MSSSDKPSRWPSGTGEWTRTRTVLVSDDHNHHEHARSRTPVGTSVVATRLQLIMLLEDEHDLVATVVLAGRYAGDRELAAFLVETYPVVRVLTKSDL